MSESQNGNIVPKRAKLIYSLDSWHCPLSAFRLISGCCVTYNVSGIENNLLLRAICHSVKFKQAITSLMPYYIDENI